MDKLSSTILSCLNKHVKKIFVPLLFFRFEWYKATSFSWPLVLFSTNILFCQILFFRCPLEVVCYSEINIT
jgi:hypothetical protein